MQLRTPGDTTIRTCDDGREVMLVRKGRLDAFAEDDRGYALLNVLKDSLELIGEAATKAEADVLLQRSIWCGPNSPKV